MLLLAMTGTFGVDPLQANLNHSSHIVGSSALEEGLLIRGLIDSFRQDMTRCVQM